MIVHLKVILLTFFLTSSHANSADSDVFEPISFVKPTPKGVFYFFDYFDAAATLSDKWVESSASKDETPDQKQYTGKWKIGPPNEASIDGEAGLVVVDRAKHHAIAAKLTTPFNFAANKTLILQYDVQFQTGQECGGGYVKLFNAKSNADIEKFNDKTPYTIMFGPDKCGANGKVHLIFQYKNPINGSVAEYHAKHVEHVDLGLWDDHQIHQYRLVFTHDGNFEVSLDQKRLFFGSVLFDLSPPLTPPVEISDVNDKKPDDWDDQPEIDDVDAVKPDDWDEEQPKTIVDASATKPSDWLEDELPLIPDPEAKKPEDWDEAIDGVWEAALIENPVCTGKSGCGTWTPPTIPNPAFKGKWRRPKIPNPNYKGPWAPRLIPNPHYFTPKPFSGLETINAIGFELWTMSSDIYFDNILVTDVYEDAVEITNTGFLVRKREDRRMKEHFEGAGFWKSLLDQAHSMMSEHPVLFIFATVSTIIALIITFAYLFGSSTKKEVVIDRKEQEKDDDGSDFDKNEEEDDSATENRKKRDYKKFRPEDKFAAGDAAEKSEDDEHDQKEEVESNMSSHKEGTTTDEDATNSKSGSEDEGEAENGNASGSTKVDPMP